MAQPARVPSFEQGFLPIVAYRARLDGATLSDAGPANRAISELALALGSGKPDKWTAAQSLRCVFATCGAFWLIAGIAFYTLH